MILALERVLLAKLFSSRYLHGYAWYAREQIVLVDRHARFPCAQARYNIAN